jgi:hypoxanthine phosphoribosyltransferase
MYQPEISLRLSFGIFPRPTPTTTDSLVFQALHDLKIKELGFTEEAPETEKFTWDEYWVRIEHVENTLNQLRSTGVYEPDVIIGISNGGLFLADTTLRLVYGNKVPLICLWALRRQEHYFDNPVNNALIKRELFEELDKLKEKEGKEGPIQVLVMDDIVGTQRTFNQLIDYLQERLGDFFKKIEVRFVFLFSPRQETIHNLARYLLSSDPLIISKFRKVEFEMSTRKRELPYRKSIHYGDITQADSIPPKS